MENFWLVALLGVSLIGLFLMGYDKRRAQKGEYRISEKTLWTCAVLGGAFGMTVGMYAFRHKTKHWQFKLGLPLLALIEMFLLVQAAM
ncbi:DUF1294 domain-containing protein [Bacillus canaveralius]|uniref:DUF1294 domain-containing protein n=1 Tax=Bacillus canaveralius TaxID=1403243 RepID=A0A2N5GJR0_9BACI|nr:MULTISPECIES: DUF1294 domain-containing protein [Bacillus]PLR81506.1 DUF1294 domain-containing protein [Bacillus canaveralius]PLR82365.1 DUF1294 domain-containing protein [Bacillus sp. V33-4]PLR93890.1 DUF1294 domain-containing protein [Bacillus canaveralius]